MTDASLELQGLCVVESFHAGSRMSLCQLSWMVGEGVSPATDCGCANAQHPVLVSPVGAPRGGLGRLFSLGRQQQYLRNSKGRLLLYACNLTEEILRDFF